MERVAAVQRQAVRLAMGPEEADYVRGYTY